MDDKRFVELVRKFNLRCKYLTLQLFALAHGFLLTAHSVVIESAFPHRHHFGIARKLEKFFVLKRLLLRLTEFLGVVEARSAAMARVKSGGRPYWIPHIARGKRNSVL